ncbi:Hypothetical predicted protein [Octopus vulgaris]|uniref:Uncharacterized protein n=1 Tax=Octopus vulgaris TaxID=6645 RepID=A0AA36BXI4_OCTVU|nr:Hypothetical predicted protein [Octopus vulgaris]
MVEGGTQFPLPLSLIPPPSKATNFLSFPFFFFFFQVKHQSLVLTPLSTLGAQVSPRFHSPNPSHQGRVRRNTQLLGVDQKKEKKKKKKTKKKEEKNKNEKFQKKKSKKN